VSVEITVKGGRVSFSKWAFKPMAATWRSRVAPIVLDALKREAPIYKYNDEKLSRGQQPGHLRDSIKLDSIGGSIGSGIEMTFISDAEYAKFVIGGTRRHRIPLSGDNFPLLHWNRDGKDTYRSWVDHPGTTANNFPKRAVEAVKGEVGRSLEVLVQERIKPEQA
jgi:hypothetical protein